MNLHIIGHGYDVSPAEREHAEKKFVKLREHFVKISDVHLTLTVQNSHEHCATAHVKVPGKSEDLAAHSTKENMYLAVDDVVKKLLVQLDKYNSILKSH